MLMMQVPLLLLVPRRVAVKIVAAWALSLLFPFPFSFCTFPCFASAVDVDIRSSTSSLQTNVQQEHDFVVNDVTFQYAHNTQEWLLFRVHARPSAVSQQDLQDLGNLFLQAYQIERNIACEEKNGFVDKLITMLHADIHTNEIQSFATQNRDARQLMEFSFLVKIYFDCVKCQATGYFVYDPPATILDDPYANPFPSHLVKPTVPKQQDVIDRMNLYLQSPTEESSNTGSVLAPSDTIRRVLSANVLHHGTKRYYTCEYPKLFTPIPRLRGYSLRRTFTTHYTLAFRNYNIQNKQDCQSATIPGGSSMNLPLSSLNCFDHDTYLSQQFEILKPIVIETYNQLNVLNAETCDPYSRIITDATFQVVDVHRDPTVRKTDYDWIFLSITLEGLCLGCDSDACTAKDVSGHATCQDVQSMPSSAVPSCYCVKHHNHLIPNAEELPTNEQFLEELNTNLQQVPDLTLIESSIYLIETDIPYTCCGWPTNGNTPVTYIKTAIQRYANGQESSHGNMINCFDTSRVTDMSVAFSGYKTFNEPLTCWDTSRVTTMRAMFRHAHAFNQNLDCWDTSNVKDMTSMFRRAYVFNGNISTWNTSQVTTMELMFASSGFNNDISNWNTSSLTSLEQTFFNTSKFNSDLSKWDTSQVTNLNYTFYVAVNFNSDIPNWNTSKITSLEGTFWAAFSFNGDISNWDTSRVTTMFFTFYKATSFNNDLSKWNTSQLLIMKSAFSAAESFNRDISMWDVSQVRTMEGSFQYANAFNQDLSRWNTSNVVSLFGTFSFNLVFNENISTWDTSKVKDMGWLFHGAAKFNRDISSWNTSQVTSMRSTFADSVFNGDIAAWDTSRVTSMQEMFYYNTVFNGDLSKWNTSRVTNMGSMFDNAAVFDQDLSKWNVGKVTDMFQIFYQASNFNQDVSAWNISQVVDMEASFQYATNFRQDLCEWRFKTDSLDFGDLGRPFKYSNCDETIQDIVPTIDEGPWCFQCVS